MSWKRAKVDGVQRCGACRLAIPKGGVYAVTRTGLVRCQRCASYIEPQPDVIEEDQAVSVPSGVTHQASLSFVSVNELARQRISNHLRQRGRR